MKKRKLFVPNHTKGLIFDLDGTLADSMKLHFQAWEASCHKYGLPCDQTDMLQYAGLSTYKIAIEVLNKCGTYTPERAAEMADFKIETFNNLHHKVKPIPSVVQLVYENDGKLPMSVGTGGTRATAHETLRYLNLIEYFTAIVAAEDVQNHKPEPDTFLKCAELMGVDPAFCTVFEDGERGILAAQRAGMKVIDVRLFL